ncbi:transposase [Gammaproteobacteria bacterium]
MTTVLDLAEEIRHELENAHPELRKTILKKLPLLVAVMLEARTANTTELAEILPLKTPRLDMRLQWISRLLGNPLLISNKIIEPFARRILAQAGSNGQIIFLTMDQEKIGDRFTILIVTVLIKGQSFPLVWRIEVSSTNLEFDWQRIILDQVNTWLPEGVIVCLMMDRPSPTEELFNWVQERGWQYQFHLQNNFPIHGNNKGLMLGDLLKYATNETLQSNIVLFNGKVTTNIVTRQVDDQGENHVLACSANLAATHDCRGYQGVDILFNSFHSKNFSLKDTQLHYEIRIDHLVLIMSLAMYWCRENEYKNDYCQSIKKI